MANVSIPVEAAIEWRQEEARRSRPPIRVAPPQSPPQPAYIPAYQRGLVALTGAELLRRDFPSREFLLSPWLPSKGLAMIFADRGIGKTWVGLNIAHAIAGGGVFIGWQATRPCRVVYIDGEMGSVHGDGVISSALPV